MKAYLNMVNKRLTQEQVWDILKLEQLIDWNTKVEVNSKLIKEELDSLLNIKNIVQIQKKLISSRNKNNMYEYKVSKIMLDEIKHRYKYLNFMLEEYRKFLKIVYISKLDEEIVFKWLDRNEFHPKLETNMKIVSLVKYWKNSNNIKNWNRYKFYLEKIIFLRLLICEQKILKNN